MGLRSTGVEEVGEAERVEGPFVASVGEQALRFCDECRAHELDASHALLGAVGANLFGLARRIGIAVVLE